MSRTLAAIIIVLVVLPVAVATETSETDAETVVHEAMARASSIAMQADSLAYLAWQDEDRGPEVAALARRTLVEFGSQGMTALRKSVTKVEPERQG